MKMSTRGPDFSRHTDSYGIRALLHERRSLGKKTCLQAGGVVLYVGPASERDLLRYDRCAACLRADSIGKGNSRCWKIQTSGQLHRAVGKRCVVTGHDRSVLEEQYPKVCAGCGRRQGDARAVGNRHRAVGRVRSGEIKHHSTSTGRTSAKRNTSTVDDIVPGGKCNRRVVAKRYSSAIRSGS